MMPIGRVLDGRAIYLLDANLNPVPVGVAGELVIGIARHQAGAHAAHLATTTADFEFGAADQRHHQLVMVMGMFMGLFIQADHTGLQHRKRLAARNKGCTLLLSKPKRRNHLSVKWLHL